MLLPLLEQQRGDQKAAEDEEDLHAQEAAGDRERVARDREQHGHPAYAVERGHMAEPGSRLHERRIGAATPLA